MIDRQLLMKCANQDRKAQFELYSQSFSLAMSIAFRYVTNREDAEAMVNEGMYKVFKSVKGFLDKGNEHTAYQAWMSRVMINTMIDDYRKRTRMKETITYNIAEEEFEVAHDLSELEEQIEAEHLQSMLERLTEMQRNVFNLFAIDGYKHDEIGEMLGIPSGTSKWHLNKARAALAEMLEVFLRNKQKAVVR